MPGRTRRSPSSTCWALMPMGSADVKIDRNAAVTPPKYRDRDLGHVMGQFLAKAEARDASMAYLWVAERRIARDIARGLRELGQQIEQEREHLRKLLAIDSISRVDWTPASAQLA